MKSGLQSFGRPNAARQSALPIDEATGVLASGEATARSLLAFGNGRSYGDTCLNSSGRLVDMRPAARILEFDPQAGVLEAEAGVLLADIIAHAAPHGFLPPVLPGTQWVTLGGAIANDIHGKNHHRRGTFGRHVEALCLLRSDGRALECGADANADLFRATIGGMGMTGLITRASVRLMPITGLDIEPRDRHQPDRGPGDQPGHAHSANRGAKKVGIRVRAALERASVGAQQAKRLDMAPERAAPVMVLAVNVVGDRAAQRHPLRARKHRRQEPVRGGMGDDVGQKHAGFGLQNARLGIEFQNARGRAHVDQPAGTVEAGVAVAAAVAEGEQAPRGSLAGRQDAGRFIDR